MSRVLFEQKKATGLQCNDSADHSVNPVSLICGPTFSAALFNPQSSLQGTNVLSEPLCQH